MKWRLYYDDGSTFDSSQGEPQDSPARCVQAIVQLDPDVGRHVLARRDYYWWHAGEWYGGDLFGLFDYLSQPGLKVVRFGRTVSNAVFRTVYARAASDPDFPRKSAVRVDEHVPV